MDKSKGPSPHLTWDELACSDGTPYPDVWRADRAVALAGAFEAIREGWGGAPVTVLSGYRTPARNKEVGGKPSSYHTRGMALDLATPHGMKYSEAVRICQEVGKRKLLGGIGVNPSKMSVHIDTRPGVLTVFFD